MGIETTPEKMESAESAEPLPAELDRETTLFAYGSLLDEPTLRKLVARNRSDFSIHETASLADAVRLTTRHPTDLVILKGVRLDGVRVSVVSDAELKRFYEREGQSVEEAVRQGIWETAAPQPESYLIARTAEEGERGRFLRGGLIMGLSPTDIEQEMDPFEIPPVYERKLVPEVTIEGKRYKPARVTFYAGGPNKPERTEADIIEAKSLARKTLTDAEGAVQASGYSEQAKWPEKVRSDRTKYPDEEAGSPS